MVTHNIDVTSTYLPPSAARSCPVHPTASAWPPPAGVVYPHHSAAPLFCCKSKAHIILTSIAVLLLAVSFIIIIVWAFNQDSDLYFRLSVPDFRINSLSVSRLNATSGQISGDWTANFTILIPHPKMNVSLNAIDGHVYYKGQLVAWSRLPGLDDAMTERNLSLTIGASALYVGDDLVRLVNEDVSYGSVTFSVKIVAAGQYKAPKKKANTTLGFFCDDLPVGFSGGGGTLTGGARNCTVDSCTTISRSFNSDGFLCYIDGIVAMGNTNATYLIH